MGGTLGGTRIAGLMAGLLLLASCAAVGGRPLVSVEGQETVKVQELAPSWAAAGPEVTLPEVGHMLTAEVAPDRWELAQEAPVSQDAGVVPFATPVKALEVPAAKPRFEVLVEPQPVQEAPVSQYAEVVPFVTPAKALEVPMAKPAFEVLTEPQPAQEAPVSQNGDPTPVKTPKVPAGPIRLLGVELRDVEPAAATVLIKSDNPIVDYNLFTLPHPPRLVIDLPKAIHAIPKGVRALAGGPIKKIRSSQYRLRPARVTRVVLDLSSNLPYQVQETPGPLQIAIGEAVTNGNGKRAFANIKLALTDGAPKAPPPPRKVTVPKQSETLPGLSERISVDNIKLALTDGAPKAPSTPRKVPVPEQSETLPGFSRRISVDLRQMDILAVMKFLAEQGNLNIVTGKNVGGRVTLSLKDVSIRDIHDIIALSYELAYVVQNGIIHVMTEADYQRLFGASFADQRQVKTLQLRYADPANVAAVLGNVKSTVGRVIADVKTRTIVLIDVPEKLEQMVATAEGMDQATELRTEVFELGYGKAEDIKAEVEKVLTPNLGAVRLDTRTNTLITTDLLSKMDEIRRVINAFDRKTREVIIEAKIVEVKLDDQFQMGINWERLFKGVKDLNLKATFPAALTSSLELTVGTLAKDNFTAVVNLLQSVGTTNLISSPKIAVVENEEAKILVGTREAFVTSVVTQTQQAATTAEEVTFIDVGVQLSVTPSINPDGFVTMKIKTEVSSAPNTLTTAAGNKIPIVETSSAETTVMVKDGVTILIGGLIKDEVVETVRKVPILGDIPFLGVAFRSKDEKVVKTELVIFLTPTIISGKESVAGATSVVRKGKNKEKGS